MKRIFEHTRTILRSPALERATIEGQNVSFEITNIETGKTITSWSETLQSMGHKSEKALVDTLKMFHYEEVKSA